tara:strand:- start:173 stop:391 length:219 start_codon:yes stop_codon:yes gene_type:complete
MDLLKRYKAVNDKLEGLTSQGDAYNYDDCFWDIDGYYSIGIDDEGTLLRRVEALENLAKAMERVFNTEIVYS